MHDEQEAITESAKAIQEVAKTSGKAIGAVEKLCRFVTSNTSVTLELAIGVINDKLSYMRWERQERLILRAMDFMKEVGIEAPTRPIPMKHAVPLLQAASLEEDDDLQDLWAKILVNATDADSGIDLQRAFISILEQLALLEVQILEKVYSLPFEDALHRHIVTFELPDKAIFSEKGKIDEEKNRVPTDEVKMALANLDRLGCLRIVKSLGGGELYAWVNSTRLGREFVKACTLRTERTDV